MGYAADVTKDVVAYRMQKAGFGDGSRIALNEEYQLKPSEDSSHGRISTLLESRPPSKILDLGCSSGLLAERLREMGHHVTGVDLNELDGVASRTDAFFQADLNDGIPPEAGTGYDIVLAADVLEHLVNPGALMQQVRDVLSPRTARRSSACPTSPIGTHASARPSGMFDYDQRGILDSTHLRFFTRRSIRRLIERQGYDIRRIESVGLPSTPSVSMGRRGTGCGWRITCRWPRGPRCSPTSSSWRPRRTLREFAVCSPEASGVDAPDHGGECRKNCSTSCS